MTFGQNVPLLSLHQFVGGFFDIPNTSLSVCCRVANFGKHPIRKVKNTFSRQPIGISQKPLTLL